MSRSTTAPSLPLLESAPAAARAAFSLLRQLRTGTLDLQLPDGTQARFGSDGGFIDLCHQGTLDIGRDVELPAGLGIKVTHRDTLQCLRLAVGR